MGRNTVSGILSVGSAKVVLLVLSILISPLLYRLLGTAGFGRYATVMSVHALVLVFVSAGVTRGVRKYAAEQRNVGDWEDQVVGFYFRIALLMAAGGALLYFLATQSGLVAYFWGSEFTPYFTIAIVMVVLAQLRSFARYAVMGFGLERYSEPLTVLNKAAFAVVGLGTIWLGYGVAGALIGQAAGSLVAAIIGFLVLTRRVELAAFLRRPSSMLPRRKMLTYNTNAILLTFLLLSLYHVDILMVQTFTNDTATGNYRAALKLAEFLWFVPAAIQTVFLHSTSELWSKGHTDRIASMASKVTRYTLLLTVVMVIGLGALAPIVVPLYWGAEAQPAVLPLLLLLPGTLGFAAVRPTLAIEEGHGKLRYSLLATGAAAGINLVLNLLLIPRYGMAGAAIATSVGYGSMFLFHVGSARALGFDPLLDARLLRIALSGVVAAVPIFLLARAIQAEPFAVEVVPGLGVTATHLLALFVVPVVGLAIFLAAAFLTRALEVEECFDLLAAFPEPIASRAEQLRERGLSTPDYGTFIPDGSQRLLLVAGLLLMVAGAGIAIAQFGVDSGGGAGAAPNETATPTTATTPIPTTGGTTTDSTAPPTATGTPGPTATPSDDPFDDPTDAPPDDPDDPTDTPTDEPTDTPTDEPTDTPTDEPTDTPTDEPTDTPTDEPTDTPTDEPTDTPTDDPFDDPTDTPTDDTESTTSGDTQQASIDTTDSST